MIKSNDAIRRGGVTEEHQQPPSFFVVIGKCHTGRRLSLKGEGPDVRRFKRRGLQFFYYIKSDYVLLILRRPNKLQSSRDALSLPDRGEKAKIRHRENLQTYQIEKGSRKPQKYKRGEVYKKRVGSQQAQNRKDVANAERNKKRMGIWKWVEIKNIGEMEDKEGVLPVWFTAEYTKFPERPHEIEEVCMMGEYKGYGGLGKLRRRQEIAKALQVAITYGMGRSRKSAYLQRRRAIQRIKSASYSCISI